MGRWDITPRGLLLRSRSRIRRRREADSPWYDQPQVDLSVEFRELQRLYWRALKRRQRGQLAVGLADILNLMAEARASTDVTGVRRKVRELTGRLHGP